MSTLVTSMAGDRVLARASYPALGLFGLLAGTLALLWSLCESWLTASLQIPALELSADSTTLVWLQHEAKAHAVKAGFLAWYGWWVLQACDTQRQLERWQRHAGRDPLTGIANRRALQQHWHALMRERRVSGRVTVLVIDLDNFKQLNDHHGHHVGDQALRRVACILKKSFQRQSDRFVGRMGGDEFIVVLPVTSMTHAAHVRRTITRKLRRISLVTANDKIIFGASVGYASRNLSEVHCLEDLTRLADHTLLDVKRKRQFNSGLRATQRSKMYHHYNNSTS
jgi:diguanylate cyclase (GGDEF)-like protein